MYELRKMKYTLSSMELSDWKDLPEKQEKEEIEGYSCKHAPVVGRTQAWFEAAVVYSTSILYTVLYSCWRFY